MTHLAPGQNTALSQPRLTVRFGLEPAATPLVLDASAFMLAESGRVSGDTDFVFHGQPAAAGGAVALDVARNAFALALDRLPATVDRIALALSIDDATCRGQRFGQLARVTAVVTGEREPIVFDLDTAGMRESAVIVLEVYRRAGQWKLRAVGQGFAGGLAPLARHFGVDVADEPDRAAAAPLPSPPPPAPPPPPPAQPVRLAKVTLEKQKPVSLDKGGGSFGEIVVNLNWSRRPVSSGWNPLRKEQGIDLDVGCMYELRSGDKGVIQALGRSFGRFDAAPWIQLMGDDRTGAASEGETLRIDGAHWADIRRILLFALIYDGVPNWAAADGVATLRTPGQPELVVRLDSPADAQRMCAVALLDNDDGRLRVTKLADYHPGHREVDRAHGFGFRWQAGSK